MTSHTSAQLPSELTHALDNTLITSTTTNPNQTVPTSSLSVPDSYLIKFHELTMIRLLLQQQLCTTRLHLSHSNLCSIGTQDSRHVSSVHFQCVRGREVIITEDPELHLVLYYDYIYVKPIVAFLYSHAFWSRYLSDPDALDPRASALGFIRTWSHFIQCRSDFDIAVEKHLLHFKEGFRTYEDFSSLFHFLHAFSMIEDFEVALRYQYGELRLSRLNLWTRLTFNWFYHQETYGQYGAYISRVISPFVFLFAFFSVALGAIQVELGVVSLGMVAPLVHFPQVGRWFSVVSLFLLGIVLMFIIMLVLVLLFKELFYALSKRIYGRMSTT